MAKKSAIARNKKRIRMVEKYSEIRNELKDIKHSAINWEGWEDLKILKRKNLNLIWVNI